MATSGRANGNGVGNGHYYFIQWQLAGQETGNNRSLINWQCYAHFQNGDNQLDNGRADWSGGNLWYNGGRVKNFEGNYATRDVGLASGSFWCGHDSVGNASFSLSGGIDYYGSGRSNAGGSWSLPQIPRGATFQNPTPASINDTTALQTGVNNPANGYIRLFMRWNTGADDSQIWATRNAGRFGGTFNWNLTTAERDLLRSKYPNAKSFGIRLVMRTYTDSGYSNLLGNAVGYDLTYNITDANPVFTNFTHRDGNATTRAITGDDQKYIQGYSQVEVTIDDLEKAVAQKSATMTKYNLAVSGISQDVAYSASDIVQNIGVLNANSDAPLTVKAIDSRTNFTNVVKTLSVLPYLTPQINATAVRTNNFEDATTLSMEAIISRLTVGGVDKNAVVNASGVKYRYKATDTSTWGAWTNRASTTTGDKVTATPVVLTLDKTKSYNIEVQVTDKLSTNTVAITVERGIPVFFIDRSGKVAVNGVPATYASDTTDYPTKLDVYGKIRSDGKQVLSERDAWKFHKRYPVVSGKITIDLLEFLGNTEEIMINLDYYTNNSAQYVRIGRAGSISAYGQELVSSGTSTTSGTRNGVADYPYHASDGNRGRYRGYLRLTPDPTSGLNTIATISSMSYIGEGGSQVETRRHNGVIRRPQLTDSRYLEIYTDLVSGSSQLATGTICDVFTRSIVVPVSG